MFRLAQFASSLFVAGAITLFIIGGLSLSSVALADENLSSCTCSGTRSCPDDTTINCPGSSHTCDECSCSWINYPNYPALWLCVPPSS